MLGLILFTIVCFLFIKYSTIFRVEGIPKSWFSIAFFLKIIAGFSLWLVYTYYYTERADADIFKYFDDAQYLFEATKDDINNRLKLLLGTYANNGELLKETLHWDKSNTFLINDNRTMIRIHILLYYLSDGYYHLHTLFFAFISFIGSYGLFTFFKQETKLNPKLILIASFAVPSLLFWASAPLKEGWLLFVLGIFLIGVSKVGEKISFKNVFILLIGILGLLSLKSYIFISLFIPLSFFILSKFIHHKNWVHIFVGIHAVAITILSLFGNKIISALSAKQIAFKTLIENEGANSAIYLPAFNDFKSIISALPIGLYNVLLRPIYPTNLSPFSLMASLEHICYFILLLMPFFFLRKISISEKRIVLFSISFILISSSVIGLSTPILGAIVRYKSPLLPFYLILLFTFVDFSKLKNSFSNR